MDFWSKMLSNIADAMLQKDLEDDTLLVQIKEALQEEKSFWDSLVLQFIKTYEYLPSKLQVCNDWLASQKIADAAKLILPVEGKMLDKQQMRCITKKVRNHLVLAGAGTGKTTTIVGYVKYLLGKKLCTPEDILVLSFTNASALEMSERLNKEIGK